MAWEKAFPELTAYLAEIVAPYNPEVKKMFGITVYFINNNMFCSVHADNVMLRLSDGDRSEVMDTYDEISLFEPLPGQIMKEYIALPEPLAANRELLDSLLKKSHSYVSSLPPKAKKGKKKKI